LIGKRKQSKKSSPQIDAIVFSPPFKTAIHGAGITRRLREGTAQFFDKKGKNHGCGVSLPGRFIPQSDNIDNLDYGKIDAIITSPPYSLCHEDERYGKFQEDQKKGLNKGHGESSECTKKRLQGIAILKESQNNIGNLEHGKIDAIVTSPPYAEQLVNRKGNQKINQDKNRPHPYSTNPRQIGQYHYGNSKKEDYEEEQVRNVLFFEPTAGFKGFEQFFHPDSVTHPAKANLHLLRWILERYTKPGDLVLDPMAGTFSTNIMASFLNRQSIGVELEAKFCQMARKNLKRFLKSCEFWKVKRPSFRIVQGDARQLSQVLAEQTDAIITSPPYAEVMGAHDTDFMLKTAKEQSEKIKRGEIRGHYMTEEARKKVLKKIENGKVESSQNIGNLECGNIDAVITSPPYEDTNDKKNRKMDSTRGIRNRASDLPKTPNNIGNLKGGNIDAVITSPPYLNETAGSLDSEIAKKKHLFDYPNRQRSTLGGDRNSVKAKEERIKRQESGNIGSIGTSFQGRPQETYLSAMLRVYREAWKVLKPNGLMVIIIKNFIRKKKVVRLDLDTIKLCEHAGFRLKERWYRQLKEQSFWRILYAKKHPEVPRIRYESILVFEKGDLNG